MNYIELRIEVPSENASEILMAQLSDWPFDSFEERPQCLLAYIRKNDYETDRLRIDDFLHENGFTASVREIEDRNWNALWESNFTPICVEQRCMIRAPFHPRNPECAYDITIMPKMSFGTGHHITTRLMVSEMLAADFTGKRGLDMGSGTGILAILAVKKGALHVDAVDVDEWAYANCSENIEANATADRITPLQGDASLLAGKRYDFVLANINRNILLADMEAYADTLTANGMLIVSGILDADIGALTEKGRSLHLETTNVRTQEGWATIRFNKRA